MAPNKDLLDQQNDLLKHMTADDPEDQQLGNENDGIQFDENEPDDSDEDDAGDDAGKKRTRQDPDDDDDDEPQQKPQRKPAVDDEEDDEDQETTRQSRFYFKADKAGNLLDKEGRILFTKGRARGIFTKLKEAFEAEERKVATASAAFNKVTETARELLTRYKELKEQNTKGKSLGLTDNEQKEALEMRALIKLDPKNAVRKILTMLHMSGTDLTDLGVTQPLDAKTVAEQVLAIQDARRPKEDDPEERARKEATDFLKAFPSAAQHTALVAEAKQKFPHMTLPEIWFQILAAARNPQNQPKKDDKKRRPNGSTRDIPRNSQPSRPTNRNGRLSIAPVDPTQSFHQIGSQLKADLKALEE